MATDRMEELLGTLNELKGEMSAMKRALEVDREAAEQRLVKKLKLDPPPTFKKKSHEKQFLFNSTVEDKLDACVVALQETPPAIEKAKSVLEEGKLLITKRQKLIKIADRSEYGWATVDEYVEDELAEGKEDERRLFRAEGRAKRRHKAYEDKRKSNRKQPIRNRSKPQSQPQVLSHSQYVAGKSASQPIQSGASMSANSIGPCFSCGQMGHLKRFCPWTVRP